MKAVRLSIVLGISVVVVLGAVVLLTKQKDAVEPAEAAELDARAEDVLPEGVATWPRVDVASKVWASIAGMEPLEAVQYLRETAAPPFNEIVFEILDEVLAQEPDSYEALIARGDAYRSLESEHELARQDFARAVEVSPRSGEAHRRLAGILVALGRHDEAIVHLHSAAKLGYDDAVTHNLLGMAYHEKGDFEKALEHYTESLERDPYSRSAKTRVDWLVAELGK